MSRLYTAGPRGFKRKTHIHGYKAGKEESRFEPVSAPPTTHRFLHPVNSHLKAWLPHLFVSTWPPEARLSVVPQSPTTFECLSQGLSLARAPSWDDNSIPAHLALHTGSGDQTQYLTLVRQALSYLAGSQLPPF